MNSKKQKPLIVPKGWGNEIIFANNEKYCGKLLNIDKGKKFSMHYHILKEETWYVASGNLLLHWIDPITTNMHTESLQIGDIIHNIPGHAHQLEAIENSIIFEVSTTHFDVDSYRIFPGDSQK